MKNKHLFCVSNLIATDFIEYLLKNPNSLSHIAECESCRENLHCFIEYCTYAKSGFPQLSNLEKSKIISAIKSLENSHKQAVLDFQWRRIQHILTIPLSQTFAVADGQNADQKLQHATAVGGYLIFRASCDSSDENYWVAKISIPTCPAPETVLRVEVRDIKGELINAGLFHFCGIATPIKNGKAFLKLADFQANLSSPSVSFEFSNGYIGEGQPILFENQDNG